MGFAERAFGGGETLCAEVRLWGRTVATQRPSSSITGWGASARQSALISLRSEWRTPRASCPVRADVASSENCSALFSISSARASSSFDSDVVIQHFMK